MKYLLTILLALLPLSLQAQDSLAVRNETIAQAKRLKSIYKIDEAVELLSGLVKPEAFDEEVMLELADCHFQSGDYSSAAGSYFLLSTYSPGNILYKIRQMQTYGRMKAWPQSIQAGKEALQLDSIPAVLSYVGDAFKQIEKPDSALWYYRRSLALRPNNESTAAKAVNILIGGKDYDGAVALADAFLEGDPDNGLVAPLKGIACYRKGDYDAAIDVLERQKEVGNEVYPVHYYLGQSYWQTNTVYRAEKELMAAWQIDSSDVNLAYSIALVKAEMFRSREDVRLWLDKAWNMVQPDPEFLSRLHMQYAKSCPSSWSEAIEHYSEAYRLNPKAISALLNMASIYEVRKDWKKALECYERYLKVGKPGSAGYDYAVSRTALAKQELFMEGK